MSGKRSDAVLAGLKTRLLEGMTANGFDAAQQEEVMRILSTVREFMFPESHAYPHMPTLKDTAADFQVLSE